MYGIALYQQNFEHVIECYVFFAKDKEAYPGARPHWHGNVFLNGKKQFEVQNDNLGVLDHELWARSTVIKKAKALADRIAANLKAAGFKKITIKKLEAEKA